MIRVPSVCAVYRIVADMNIARGQRPSPEEDVISDYGSTGLFPAIRHPEQRAMGYFEVSADHRVPMAIDGFKTFE